MYFEDLEIKFSFTGYIWINTRKQTKTILFHAFKQDYKNQKYLFRIRLTDGETYSSGQIQTHGAQTVTKDQSL